MLHALRHLENRGIVHRDIKPENIMLCENDEVKIIDFGLATNINDSCHRKKVGTPFYFAPEVHQGYYGPECDIWALGIILY